MLGNPLSQGIVGPALAALLFISGIGGLLGNRLSVRLIRRFGATNDKCNGSSAIGASIGARARTMLEPRFMPWVGCVFVVAALACSMLGERAAERTRVPAEESG